MTDSEKEKEKNMKMNSHREIEDIILKETTINEETKISQIGEGREGTSKIGKIRITELILQIILETTKTRKITMITTEQIDFSNNRKKTINKEKIKIPQRAFPCNIYKNQCPDQTQASRMG
jgi:hypothetical protein